MNINERQRNFIVGCPRSGTTLLQAHLATHPQIFSLPETHYFNKIIGSGWTKHIGLANREQGKQILKDMIELHTKDSDPRVELEELIPKFRMSYGAYARAFSKTLDQVTRIRGYDLWIEKTPSHLYRIDRIERYINGPGFVHIVRNGKDVVASLFEVTRKYPEVWGGPRSIEQCVDRWNNDIRITLEHTRKDHHILITYEDLVSKTERVLKALCGFLGVDYQNSLIREHKNGASQVVPQKEEWVQNAFKPVENRNKRKFENIFSQSEKEWIRDHLLQVDLPSLLGDDH